MTLKTTCFKGLLPPATDLTLTNHNQNISWNWMCMRQFSQATAKSSSPFYKKSLLKPSRNLASAVAVKCLKKTIAKKHSTRFHNQMFRLRNNWDISVKVRFACSIVTSKKIKCNKVFKNEPSKICGMDQVKFVEDTFKNFEGIWCALGKPYPFNFS